MNLFKDAQEAGSEETPMEVGSEKDGGGGSGSNGGKARATDEVMELITELCCTLLKMYYSVIHPDVSKV